MVAAAVCWSTRGLLVRMLSFRDAWEIVFWRSLFMAIFVAGTLFVIHRGSGIVRHGASRTQVRAGDAVLHPAGPEAHQLINTGATELEYFLIADNPAVDVWHYPDSAKWGYRPDGGYFRKHPVDYYLDEEDGLAAEAPPAAVPEPTAAHRARFVSIDSIQEETRLSPKGRFGSFRRAR